MTWPVCSQTHTLLWAVMTRVIADDSCGPGLPPIGLPYSGHRQNQLCGSEENFDNVRILRQRTSLA
jgi:hypothetical protein